MLKKNSYPTFLGTVLFCLSLMATCSSASAENDFNPQHKVILQATSADPQVHNLVLVIAAGLQQHYGMDNVKLEVVAYGPGVDMLKNDSEFAPRVKSLAAQNITFSACNNTLKYIEQQTGKKPLLTEGVQVVTDGVVRLIELQEQGYSYVYPK